MVPEVSTKDMEAALLKSLRGVKVKADLKPVGELLGSFSRQGILLERFRWKGFFEPDILHVSGRVSADKIGALVGILQDKRLERFRGFPKGLPPLDRVIDFQLEIAV